MNKILIILFAFFCPIILYSQNKKDVPQVKLVVQIVVEQMRYEILERYWNRFSDDGFKRLAEQGTFCKNANYNYSITESSPGYATISTGSNPAQHSIVADKLYHRIYDKQFDCVVDKSLKNVSLDFDRNKYSPKAIIGSTFGDELLLSNYKKSKVISVSLNHRAAVLAGGKLAQAAYWFDSSNGKWISSAFYMNSLPKWVNDFNDRELLKLYLNRTWNTFKPISSYTNSLADNNSYELGFAKGEKVFPYNMQKLSKREGVQIIQSTPYGNTYTTDFSIATILEENLGQDEFTDLLTISYTSTSHVNRLFSLRSIELEDTYIRLDRDIAHLINMLDDRIGLSNVIIVLTADRGAADNPVFLKEIGAPTGNFHSERSMYLLESYLKAIYGRTRLVKHYENRQVYLNQLLIERCKLSLQEVQQKSAEFIAQFEAVAQVAVANDLQKASCNNKNLQKLQNTYHISHSGDILIDLKPGYLEVKKHKARNYIEQSSPYKYDTHVPLIFFGWKIKKQEILTPVSITDIAPTLSNLLNISYPSNSTGQAIDILIR